MKPAIEGNGKCLCGAISFTVIHMNDAVDACHCSMCRKWGGGPLMSVDCGTDVIFDGAENISVYDSSAWAERGFCSKCGSHLFYRLKDNNEYQIPVGLFEDQDHFNFDLQVFIDSKPSFYSFANETREMTAAQAIAAFAPDKNS